MGISTVLFTMWGCVHTCVVHHRNEAVALEAYLDRWHVDTSLLTIHIGPSQDILPRLAPDPLDVVFIDGGHGFPVPILDWYYAGSRIRRGGLVVIDDLDLRSVRLGLLDFLELDPRWEERARKDNWAAWHRLSHGSLGESWRSQPFLGPAPW